MTAFFRKPYYAWRGLSYILRRESSFRFQLVVAAVVLLGAWYFELSRTALAVLLLAAGGVLVVEVFNTFLERLLDVIEPRFSHHAGVLKDILAAAALIMGLAALAAIALLVVEFLS